MQPSIQPPPRDQRLDFWRGLCLIDMVFVHLYYANVQFGDFLGRLLGEYTRFAAGGFIFVSGLSIGVIFWPRAQDNNKRASTYRRMWRRSGYILGVHYVSAIVGALIAICIGLFAADSAYGDPLTVLRNFAFFLRNLLFLREGGDLLPLYVLMIAVSPLIMHMLRRKWGWLAVLVASVSIFAWGLWHPYFMAIAQPPKFPPLLWQIIFVCGLLLGWAWPKYNALAKSSKLKLAIACWLAVAVLFVMEYSYQWGMPGLSLGVAFTKVPLSTAETLRYLFITFALITTTDLLWPLIGPTSAAAFVQTLGRKTLAVYVVHLWLVEIVGYLATQVWPGMGSWQIILVGASVLVLWLFALILDVMRQPKKARPVATSAIPSMFRSEAIAGAAR
jgi:hypothetical protein